jgi:hypothetical protein
MLGSLEFGDQRAQRVWVWFGVFLGRSQVGVLADLRLGLVKRFNFFGEPGFGFFRSGEFAIELEFEGGFVEFS